MESQFHDFFGKYPYYDTPEKQGLFLLGVLTQQLLNLQQDIRKAQPFKKQLKGYKMLEGIFAACSRMCQRNSINMREHPNTLNTPKAENGLRRKLVIYWVLFREDGNFPSMR